MRHSFYFQRVYGVALLAGAILWALPGAQTVAGFTEALTGGTPSLDLRYRYEHVEQDNALKDADASTLRSRLAYATRPYHGISGYLEFENITVLGAEEYNSGINGETAYSAVIDPEGTEVNQTYILAEVLPATQLKFGRQRIGLDNHRFVGNVGWRQNEQTFDAFSVVNKSLPATTLSYAHLSNVNRITSIDADMSSDLFNANYSGWAAGTLSGYVYLLDYAQSAALSSATYGLRFSGATALNDVTKLLYGAEFAKQGDYGDNPGDFDLNYLLAELGLDMHGVSVKMGYEVLEGDGTYSVQTPLATLHAFNGWADQFLSTPASGLEDIYVSVAGELMGVNLLAVYHDYSANSGGGDFGSEINLQASKKFNKLYALTVKYASYRAGDQVGKDDTDKIWLMGQVSF